MMVNHVHIMFRTIYCHNQVDYHADYHNHRLTPYHYCVINLNLLGGNLIATLGSILDFQLSWKSGKFQLARWSHKGVLFFVENWLACHPTSSMFQILNSQLAVSLFWYFGHVNVNVVWCPINKICVVSPLPVYVFSPPPCFHHQKVMFGIPHLQGVS